MSISGSKALCDTQVGLNSQGVAVYQTLYTLTIGINGHINGGVETLAEGLVESVFNLAVQQAVADKVNQETTNADAFEASDVFGGRI